MKMSHAMVSTNVGAVPRMIRVVLSVRIMITVPTVSSWEPQIIADSTLDGFIVILRPKLRRCATINGCLYGLKTCAFCFILTSLYATFYIVLLLKENET